jgi:purine-binding chemotaxis protein CheW
MITLRGQSTAVIDLNAVLGVPCERRDRRARMIAVHHNSVTVCLLVDQIDGLHGVTDADLEPPPPVIADLDIQWLSYVTRSAAGELIAVINVDRILSQASLAGMEVETASV